MQKVCDSMRPAAGAIFPISNRYTAGGSPSGVTASKGSVRCRALIVLSDHGVISQSERSAHAKVGMEVQARCRICSRTVTCGWFIVDIMTTKVNVGPAVQCVSLVIDGACRQSMLKAISPCLLVTKSGSSVTPKFAVQNLTIDRVHPYHRN